MPWISRVLAKLFFKSKNTPSVAHRNENSENHGFASSMWLSAFGVVATTPVFYFPYFPLSEDRGTETEHARKGTATQEAEMKASKCRSKK